MIIKSCLKRNCTHEIKNDYITLFKQDLLAYLSLLINMPISEALGIQNHSFHIGLITFSFLFLQFSGIFLWSTIIESLNFKPMKLC